MKSFQNIFCKGGAFILHAEALIFAARGGLISLAAAHISLCQEVGPHISLCQEVEPDPLPPWGRLPCGARKCIPEISMELGVCS